MIKGPTTADRVVAFDAASAVIMCIVGVVSVIYDTDAYLDSIMLIAIISFVSSVSISRFIGGGRVFNGTHKSVTELIASILIFLGSIIAVISAIGIVNFKMFLRSHASTKSSTLSVLLTLIGALIYFTTVQGFFSVRLLLSIVFINLTSPVGMHLVARAAYRTGAYMYRKMMHQDNLPFY